ncbi:RusA family crossover junction endodeoxyribonuclease [Candidatus Chlorohelix sp.]|uniref:RusA family crossover junction endodeoxyribonuclease n=1 Tax=Candidatus Chlorohelix sp. TaxID=3139201 RepID=UPI0030639430
MIKKSKGSGNIRGNKLPTLEITLPLPPSINVQYATVEGKRTLTETARKWKRQVERRVEQLEDEEVITDEMLAAFAQTYLSVFMQFFFPSPHRRDLDGGLKIALDALCEALHLNDNRVVEIHLQKRIDPLDPRVEIFLEGVNDWVFDEQYVLLEDNPAQVKKIGN